MRQRRLMNQINVVPYIDVMLVLLVIFMVATPMMQPTGTIDLPSVDKASVPQPAAPPPLTLEVKAKGDFSLRDAKGAQKMSLDAAIERIRAAQSGNALQAVVIAADKDLRYEEVVGVMDQLKRAQIQRIGLLVTRK
jgi:biopolymer transport protein TolR